MSRQHISVFVCLAICFTSSICFAGKLGSLRSKTRDSGGSKTKASSPASKRDRSERPDNDAKRSSKSDKRGTSFIPTIDLAALMPKSDEDKSQTKLSSVRDRVRRSDPKPSNARPPRDKPSRNRPPRDHRPSRGGGRVRGGFGFSFGPTFPTTPCPPPATLVTERFYYPQPPTEPWTYDNPYMTPAPYVEGPILASPQVPPVMPPVPAEVVCTESVSEPFDICEDLSCNELSCNESVVTTAEWPINPYHIRFEIDYAGDEADVSRMGFGLLANVTRGLGIDTGLRLFRERDADFRDHLWLGDFTVTYELAASEWMRMRAGLGVNFLADWYGADSGLNLTVGADIFMGPITLAGELDLGSLGDTDLFHSRVSAAWRCDEHVEAFVGYDYVDIGGVEFAGLLAGLRFRY